MTCSSSADAAAKIAAMLGLDLRRVDDWRNFEVAEGFVIAGLHADTGRRRERHTMTRS